MKDFRVRTVGVESLSDLLRSGLVGFASEIAQHNRKAVIWLFLHGGVVLRVNAVTNDVDDWEEVGTLVFSRAGAGDAIPTAEPLDDWRSVVDVSRLVIMHDDVRVESGVRLVNDKGDALTILAGALPFTVEVKAPFCSGDFQPEYDVEQYRIEPM